MKPLPVTLAVFLFVTGARADDWNAGTGGKPSRNSRSSERGPASPVLLWQNGLPAVIAQPAVTEGNIVAMSRIFNLSDVQQGTLIVAQSLTTGETLWTKNLPVDFPTTDWRNRVMAIRNGRVYATRSGNDNNSFLYALDALTGAILWRSRDSIGESSTESPAFAPNGDLIVGSLRDVTRINATNGARMWRSSRASPTSNGNEAAVFGNKVYLWEASGQGPKISVFNLATGAFLYSSPAVSGGLVQQLGLFVGPDGTVYAPRTQNNITTDFLVAFKDNDTTLVEKWRAPLGYVPFASFGAGPDGSVYSYSRDKRVVRLNPLNGSVLDSSEVIGGSFFFPRIAIDSAGIVFVTNGGGSATSLYSYNPDLTLRWSEPVPSVNIAGPAIGRGGTLVVCGTGIDVRAYRGSSTAVDERGGMADVRSPALHQNYPNPFNPATTISFSIPRPSFATLRIFDLLGRQMQTLVNAPLDEGEHRVRFDAAGLASGVYVYRLESSSVRLTRKMVLTR